ncbi:MAG: DUF3566 domain-containing protein [Acidimicrobiales bacterium]
MSAPQTESSAGLPVGEPTGTVTAIDVVSAGETVAARAGGRPASGAQTVSRRNLLGRKQRFEARRVRRIIRHIDPWSVLKLSLVFFLCVWVMFMVAVVIIWSIAQSSGTVDKIEGFISDLGVAGWKLNGTFIFRQYGLFGLVMVFACTTATVVSTIVFNLISDLIGGVWISVIEEETSRPIVTDTTRSN